MRGEPRTPVQEAKPEIDLSEVERLRQRLDEAEETLRAIRTGKVDAVVVSGPEGEKVFALKGAEQPYRIFVEAMNEGAATLLANGAIAYSNARFAQIVEKPLEQVTGAHFEDFVAPDYRTRSSELRSRALTDGCREEIPLLTGKGNLVWTRLSLSPIAMGSNKGICLVAEDVTERKRAQEALQKLTAELEERVRIRTAELESANQELESFSYTVSHDLRAPLRAISGFSTILVQDYAPNLPAEAQRMLRKVASNAELMGRLISDLLAFAHLGRQPLTMKPVDTNELVRKALSTLSAEQENRRVEIHTADLPACHGDPALLQQVFVNLLSNALKYSRKREIARVELGAAKAGDLPKGILPDNIAPQAVVYYIRDNGIGFDMQYATKLFRVFERLHSSEEYEGTGVGLAIVRRIIERHGGRVWANAAVDQGATFYFMLPPPPPCGKLSEPDHSTKYGSI